ncbi:restriction endonuclease subunit S [uncultured Capnocytophaga sp.]|uniref:restriction endonuclease subunit S n=1 Tax=uncultured Capnocytophaga sp. TaxID=159273 RepID=UPI0026076033|nr:restriction endonuclease subunit S [uncultured Capnocytophaga sp.]
MFLTNLSEVTGKRWDAFEFKNRKLKLGDGNYPNKTLKHLAYLLKGQSITSNEIEKGDYPVIAGGQISPYTHNRYNFKGNVITISASGAYSGYVWYHNYPIFASDCRVVFSKEESEITTLYLSEILKLKQKEIYNLQQGAGQPHVYARDLEKINIPIPSLQKQKDITNKITAIREEAKKLQLEAINTLETAKRNIEQMILGD